MGTVFTVLSPHRVLEDIVIHIKVGGVSGRGHVRDVGSLSSPDVVPVYPTKKWVALEVGDPIETKARFPGAQQALDQVFGILGHISYMGGELETLLETNIQQYTRLETGMLQLYVI